MQLFRLCLEEGQSFCASEEGNGSQYIGEKRSSTAGMVRRVIMCCVLLA